ncbi:MAG TPA: hypothetical protein VGJ20_09040 [Xanthobacteraceae bacterium]|jgi:hypothetical protein
MPLPIRKLAECYTEHEKSLYYAEVYAWRIVRGYGLADDKTCPVDPKGERYNPALIDEAISSFRRIIAAERRQHTERESCDNEVQAQNRRYARGQAYRAGKLDEYDAVHHPEKLAQRGAALKALAEQQAIHDELAALGVTATEVKQEVNGGGEP